MDPHHPLCENEWDGLERYDAFGGWALLALDDFEFHLLSIGQRTEALGLDGAMMDEDVFTAFALDEAEAFSVVEPLNGSPLAICHIEILLYVRLEQSERMIVGRNLLLEAFR